MNLVETVVDVSWTWTLYRISLLCHFGMEWIVPLILSIIVNSPVISNMNLRHALSAHGKEHLLTDSILLEARSHPKAQLFGIAAENVKYAEGMKSELEKDGHIVKLMYTSRKTTLHNVEQLVVAEELLCLKSATNGTLDRDELGVIGKKKTMPCLLISLDTRAKNVQDFSMVCSLHLPFHRRLFPSFKHYSRLMHAT